MLAIDGYSIGEQLHQGQSSAIFRATRDADGAAVIVKLLDLLFPTALDLARVRHEFELLQRIDHPGVVKAHAIVPVGNSLAIVLEHCDGVPLRRLMDEGRLALADKLRLGRDLATTLAHIHALGIVHKDINPNNVLFSPGTGQVTLIDFGNASVLVHEKPELRPPEALSGTLAYIAPEQSGRMNRPVDYRSDYYALGVTLYELLAGRRPFEAADGMALVHKHMAATAPPVHELEPEIPPALSKIVDKLLQKNPEQRYQSAAGIAFDLASCIEALDAPERLAGFIPGGHDASDRFSPPTSLYGREAETARLMGAFSEASDGRPNVMLVTGHSGSGKSSLINEIHKPIARRNGFFVSGKFDQFQANVPYSAFIQACQQLLSQILTESDEVVGVWRERILEAVDTSGQVIIDVIPELRHVIGPQPALPTLGAQETQNRFNYYFVNFIRVFADADRALVLFIDDLQWADSPSLNLIEHLATDPGCRKLLLLGAYRDNEVPPGHRLQLTLERLSRTAARVETITLTDLPEGTVAEIVADTVGADRDEVAELATLLHRRTAGNPFFLIRLLHELHGSGLIAYDHQAQRWRWDITQIRGVDFSENVVTLMARNIRTLPAESQRLLQLAACNGSRFTLHELALIGELPHGEIIDALRPALEAELVLPIGDEYKFARHLPSTEPGATPEVTVRYRFLHDRVQQAAYDLLSDEEKIRSHFKVGQLLLRHSDAEQLAERLFDVVNHFNRAESLAVDPALIGRLIELNLQAAAKAKHSIAYEPALGYATMARRLLARQPAPEHALRLRALLEQAECEALNGHGAPAEALYREGLALARDDDERAVVYEMLIHFYSNSGEFRAAYQTGREALRLFGVRLPTRFIPLLFILDFLRAKLRLRGRRIPELIDLPLCRDERRTTAMRLIGALLKAAYQLRPELCIANAVKAVNLSLKYGTMEDNAVAYLVFGGIFVGGVTGDHTAGYEFAQLALAMNDRFENIKQRAEINFVSAYFTNIWLHPAEEAERYYRAAYDAGLQTGDFFHLSCAACTLVESQFIRGVPLAEVRSLGENHLAFMERIDSSEAAGAITAVLRTVLNLEGATEGPDSFGDATFDETAFAERLRGFTSLHFAHFYFVNKMQSLYLWGRIDEALAAAQTSAGFLRYSLAMLHTTEHHFWHGLILCAAHARAPRAGHLRKARRILRKLEGWAKLNPANFAAKARLLRAEIECRHKDDWRAAALYQQAIEAAGESGFSQIKALANERAARLYLAHGIEPVARSHLREAHYGYTMWGATGIAGRLSEEFPGIAFGGAGDEKLDSDVRGHTSRSHGQADRHTSLPTSVSSSSGRSNLDLDTVLKATQALSQEIRLGALLEQLVRLMIENAGAQWGCYIRVDDGRLLAEAESRIGQSQVTLLGGTPIDPERLPGSIIHYVARTAESVVLTDAETDSRFWADPYVTATRPKSLLCAPVIRQDHVTGIMYLENNLTSDAFTPARLEVLRMLAAQAAVSIENSLLYASLEQRVEARTRELSETTLRLQQANAELERLTYTDALTQVSNKRHFEQVYEKEWKRALRASAPLAVVIIDIDSFKRYNDTYGHVQGDLCLQKVAGALAREINRAGDLLARFGGEEFVVLLPNTETDDAEAVAARLIDGVRALGIPHAASDAADHVTISLGYAATVPDEGVDRARLIEAADEALYRAKSGGKDRFCA